MGCQNAKLFLRGPLHREALWQGSTVAHSVSKEVLS
jgi:hypothetical protein